MARNENDFPQKHSGKKTTAVIRTVDGEAKMRRMEINFLRIFRIYFNGVPVEFLYAIHNSSEFPVSYE